MPVADNAGVPAYYETEGSGPPLVMYHGLTGTGQRWRDCGYVEALRERYTLLLLDARGHGRSGAPHDPALCSRRHRAADVLAVLDAEGIERAAFWGHSLGGMVGFTLGHDQPERIAALVLTGYNPFPMSPAEAAEVQGWIGGLRGGMEPFVAGWEANHGPLPADVRAKWLANDHLALVASMEAWVAGSDGSQAAELPRIPVPTLLLVGTEEPFYADACRAAEVMPNATVVSLPGFDHLQTFLRSDALLPHALPFLAHAI